METSNIPYLSDELVRAEQASFMRKVYSWMTFALLITGLVALWVASTPNVAMTIVGNKILFYGMIIGELACVIYLSARISKMTAQTAVAVFILYSCLNGLTLSVIFMVFTAESLASTFFITAGTFAAMSAYGYFTKKDLSSWGNILMMSLIGIIIASVVNIFFQNEMLYWIVTYVGVLVFVGLTAYDTQKIKAMNIIGNEGTEEDRKEAIMGALTLYLDFINLFLMLLRLFGDRK